MKHMKKVEIAATTRDETDFVTCDLCGECIEEAGYNIDEIEVRHRTGKSYPESGAGKETYVDMCGKCFDEKLVPWLRTQGAEPYIEVWDE